MILSNYHMHSHYCDGHGQIEDYIREALARGLVSIGTSSHVPLPFHSGYNMPLEKLPEYHAEITALQQRYAGQIQFYRGLELEYLPGNEIWQIQILKPYQFDYFVGSVHFVGNDDRGVPWAIDASAPNFERGLFGWYEGGIERLTRDYYRLVREMALAGGFDILGHLDLIKKFNADERYFSEDAPWYQEAVEETLQVIAAHDVLVEINTAGWRKAVGDAYPSEWILRRCRSLGIRLTVDADAHFPQDITKDFDRAVDLLHEVGYSEVFRLEQGQWQAFGV